MPHEETWIKTRCDECDKVNWICEGDMQDLTVSDTLAIECWQCGHNWWRGDYFGDEELLSESTEKGRETTC